VTSPRTRPYTLPAALWTAGIVLSIVQLVLVIVRDDHDPSLPLGILIGALFLTALALTLVKRRR
jgi:hypothetical protein